VLKFQGDNIVNNDNKIVVGETQAGEGGMSTNEKLELPIKWGWLLALGMVMAIVGTLGLFLASYLTLASVIIFGAFALIGGSLQLWHGVTAKEVGWSGRALHLLVALAYLVFGGILLWDPVSGSISLTLIIAVFLFVLGVSRWVYAWRCRRRGWHWGLIFFGGLMDLFLAAIIIYGWPTTAFWVIGLFVAIEMLFNGWWLVAIALSVRTVSRVAQNEESRH
jgi:uncharacterized membrane protein HdeD (DUF308 family)